MSWYDDNHTITDYAIDGNAIELNKYLGNDEWNLIRVTGRKNLVKYPCCRDPYSDITFNITIRRKTLFYTVNLLIPCIAINMLTYLTFYLPANCGEKISLSICTLLSLSLFQLLLLELMPPTSIKIPLLGKYILFTTVVISLSIFSSVIVLHVQFRDNLAAEPKSMTRKLFFGALARMVMIQRPEISRSSSSMYQNLDQLRPQHANGVSCSQQRCLACSVHYRPANTRRSCGDVITTCTKREARSKTSQSKKHRLPVTARKAIDGVVYIAKRTQAEDQRKQVRARSVLCDC